MIDDDWKNYFFYLLQSVKDYRKSILDGSVLQDEMPRSHRASVAYDLERIINKFEER